MPRPAPVTIATPSSPRSADARRSTASPRCRRAETQARLESAHHIGGSGSVGAGDRRIDRRRARSSARPSAAEAPVGSPSTPFGDTARTPRARSSSISSASGAAFPAPPALAHRGRPDRRYRWVRTTALGGGGQGEHQRGLGAAGVGVAAEARRQARTSRPSARRQLDRGGERRGVAAVGVDEDEAVEGLGRRAAELDQDQLGRRGADRERPGEVLVLAARAVGEGRGDDGAGHPRRGALGERDRDRRVGPDRQVRAVLLGRPERHQQRRRPDRPPLAGPRPRARSRRRAADPLIAA